MTPILIYSPTDLNHRLAYDAHRGTSFSPEVRADQEVQSYLSAMADMVAEFEPFATDDNRAELATDLEQYRQGYLKHIHAKLAADSRCMSSMITGPSNFPVARNQKRLDAAHKRLEEFLEWEKRAIERLRKKYDPSRQSAVISSDSPDAIQQLLAKINQAQQAQESMKKANLIIRKKIEVHDKIAQLVALGLDQSTAVHLLTPDYMGRIGFPDYALSNNSANIRRMKERVAGLELERNRQQTHQQTGKGERTVNGIRVVENTDLNRIQLFFPGKPSAEVRDKLKRNGFHWSPREGAWQRQLNEGSRRVVEGLVGNIELKKDGE